MLDDHVKVLNNIFCNAVTVFKDKRQFQGFYLVLTCPNCSKSTTKLFFSPNKEIPILKLMTHFALCHARTLPCFFVLVVVFSIQININSFNLDLYCDDMFLEIYQHPTPLTVILFNRAP